MKRFVPSVIVVGTIVAGSLGGLVACSNDTPKITKSNQTGNSSSSSVPGAVPLVPGLSAECQAIYQAIGGAAQAAAGGSDSQQAKAIFASLVGAVPNELKADARTFADAYGTYLDILVKYKGDTSKAMADPAVVAALAKLSSADVRKASEHLTTYMDASCHTGS